METMLTGLRAAAEPTRLRLLALLAQGDLTVSELTHIMGQSQPRISRHLKLLCEAGLLDRFPEGAWVFYRVSNQGAGAQMVRSLFDQLPADDPVLVMDRRRLETVRADRATRAQEYFTANAARWDEIRSLHVDEAEVERLLADAFTGKGVRDLVDLGTGTGRVLEILAPHVERGTGIDLSREMLTVARANLEKAGVRHCMVRQGDITQLPLPAASADAVTIHQVLHFTADPAAVVTEAARILRPGGTLVIVDFAPHDQETLRDDHAHHRLGFSDAEVSGWLRAGGLELIGIDRLPGNPLTVVVWRARRARTTATTIDRSDTQVAPTGAIA